MLNSSRLDDQFERCPLGPFVWKKIPCVEKKYVWAQASRHTDNQTHAHFMSIHKIDILYSLLPQA